MSKVSQNILIGNVFEGLTIFFDVLKTISCLKNSFLIRKKMV